MCCSSYTNDASTNSVLPVAGPPAGSNDCEWANDYYCDDDPPWQMWCASGTDCSDCGYPCQTHNIVMPPPPSTGLPGDAEGGCVVNIDGPGTFIGTFLPLRHEDTPAAEAQLLSKRRRDSSSAPSSSSSAAFSELGQRLVFRGKFVPDSETSVASPSTLSSASPSTLSSAPSLSTASFSMPPAVSSPYAAYDDTATHHQFMHSRVPREVGAPKTNHTVGLGNAERSPPDATRRQARVGAPGGPGGMKHFLFEALPLAESNPCRIQALPMLVPVPIRACSFARVRARADAHARAVPVPVPVPLPVPMPSRARRESDRERERQRERERGRESERERERERESLVK